MKELLKMYERKVIAVEELLIENESLIKGALFKQRLDCYQKFVTDLKRAIEDEL